MNVRFLETFVWLARLKSFRATAARLNTTQPAVSARIRSLEEELGVALFVRDHRNIHLTPEGVEALRHAEAMVGAAQQLKERVADPTRFRGTVRLGAIDAIVQTWLPALIEEIRRDYPQVIVEINVDTTLNLTRGLRAGDLGIAFFIEPMSDGHFVNVDICTYAMAWVASPRLVDPERTLSLEELAALPIIAYPPNSPPYRFTAAYFHDGEVLRAQASSCNSLSTMIRLAEDGLGLGAIPPVCIRRELAERRLVVVPVAKPFPAMAFNASFRASPKAPLIDVVLAKARDTARAFCDAQGPGLAWVPGGSAEAGPGGRGG